MEMHGKQIVTRGVPNGYGYIRKYFKGKDMTKYWPVKLVGNNDFKYLYSDEGNPLWGFEREQILAMIAEDRQGEQAV